MGQWIGTHQRWPLTTITSALPPLMWMYDLEQRTTISIADQHIDHFSLHAATTIQVHGPELQSFIRYRTGWTADQFNLVNWPALCRVIKSQPLHYRTTTMKAMYGWLHTSHWQERIYGTSSLCPMCASPEDNDHLWVCPVQLDDRRSILDTMIDILTELGTPQLIVTTIYHGLSSLFNLHQDDEEDCPRDLLDPLITKVSQARDEQESLGWDNFLRG